MSGEQKDDFGVMVITQTQIVEIMYTVTRYESAYLQYGGYTTQSDWQKYSVTDSTLIFTSLAYSDLPQRTLAYTLSDGLLTIGNPGSGKVAWKQVAP